VIFFFFTKALKCTSGSFNQKKEHINLTGENNALHSWCFVKWWMRGFWIRIGKDLEADVAHFKILYQPFLGGSEQTHKSLLW